MIKKIDHIGIAVNSVEDTIKLYRDVFDLKVGKIETEEAYKIKLVMIDIGDSSIELLESTDSEGPIAKYIGKRGEGIHHLALGVKNIQGVLTALKEKGIPLIDEKPRVAIGGAKIAFLHPKGTKILIELVEH